MLPSLRSLIAVAALACACSVSSGESDTPSEASQIDVRRDAGVQTPDAGSGVADAEGVYKIAQAFAVLNDKPTALRLLRRSIEGGFVCYPYFTNDPLLDNLRGEVEFAELMERARRRHEDFKRQFST